MAATEQIAGGIWHWCARHEHTGAPAHSYYFAAERVALDPMIPSEGLEWFEARGRPEHVLLTNRHHDRHAWELRDAFGCEIHCVREGIHELEDRGPVTPFDFGDELPGGAIAHEVGSICPDETALHFPSHHALACADGAIRAGAGPRLTFVPDYLMDRPQATKDGLREAYASLLELDFDTLLLAHGEPIVGFGRDALRSLADGES